MRAKATLKGKIVGIRFYDHSIGSEADLIECEVFGRVMQASAKGVVVEHWSIFCPDKETVENNRERVCIVQETIISITEYSPKRINKFY